MSDTQTGANPTPAPGLGKGAAGGDFQHYQAGGAGSAGHGMALGWAMPPSYVPTPPWSGGYRGTAQALSPSGSAMASDVGQSLGATLRLGLDVFNALLSSTMSALAGAAAMSHADGPPGYGDGWNGHGGCGCGSCAGRDCCDIIACSCCQSRVSGCCS